MFFFAYDGTIHGDWVSHYAVRLASHHPSRDLRLVHVAEGGARAELTDKLGRIERECAAQGVTLHAQTHPKTTTVLATLRSLIPEGPDTFVVCGTRARRSKLGLLSGTVSAGLLSANRFHVLAVRVMQPGLLGLSRDPLIPVARRPGGLQAAVPFLRLFAPDIRQLHILHVERVSRFRFRRLSFAKVERLRAAGQAYCERIERELGEQVGLRDRVMDASVVISDDVPKEIVILANRVKSQLIYLGASERSLTERFFYGNPIEQVLREATCDVAVYRSLE